MSLPGWPARARPRVRDRTRGAKGRLRRLGRSLKRRNGEAKQDVLQITKECGDLLALSVAEARKLHGHLAAASAASPGDGGVAAQAAAVVLAHRIADCERVCGQTRSRLAGEKIGDRLVSLHDRDARPICKRKLSKRTEFGYVEQICEVTENTTGGRGYILAPATAAGNPGETTLLPATLAHIDTAGFEVRELSVDGGFAKQATIDAVTASGQQPVTVSIAGGQEPDSPRTRRRL